MCAPKRPALRKCSQSLIVSIGMMKMKFDSSLPVMDFSIFIPKKVALSALKWKPAICCGCRGERGTGLTSAMIDGFEPFACSRMLRDGRPTTPKPGWTKIFCHCVSAVRTFHSPFMMKYHHDLKFRYPRYSPRHRRYNDANCIRA